MPRLKVAHLHEQGQDMIVVPLDRDFGRKSDRDQHGIVSELQARSSAAGLKGTVVAVWDEHGRMAFIAPQPWHPLFRSVSLDAIIASLNKELSW